MVRSPEPSLWHGRRRKRRELTSHRGALSLYFVGQGDAQAARPEVDAARPELDVREFRGDGVGADVVDDHVVQRDGARAQRSVEPLDRHDRLLQVHAGHVSYVLEAHRLEPGIDHGGRRRWCADDGGNTKERGLERDEKETKCSTSVVK